MDVVRFVAKLYVFDDVFTCFIRVVVVLLLLLFSTPPVVFNNVDVDGGGGNTFSPAILFFLRVSSFVVALT